MGRLTLSQGIAREIVTLCDDPLKLIEACWPKIVLYDKQVEILYSIRDNRETVVPAANMLGKDYVAGLVVLWFFISRTPCRIVTTSAGDDHLRVLWGEIGRFIDTSAIPLNAKKGGPLVVNHQELKKVVDGEIDKISYVKGLVASPDNIAKMQGHHANPDNLRDAIADLPRSMFVSDESSSVKHSYYTMASTWFKRAFIFGNTWPCDNFFKYAIKGEPGTNDKGGDIPRDELDLSKGYHRKIIKITAADSPNVLQAQHLLKLRPDLDREYVIGQSMVVPGVIDFREYEFREKHWDPIRKSVSLYAEFPEDESQLMYPPLWLNRAEEIASQLPMRTKGLILAIDSAEGGDETCWTVIDDLGLIHQEAQRTRDTAVIVPKTIALARQFGVLDTDVIFDRGGGGQQHADSMRKIGWKVRTVGFGEGVDKEKRRVSPGMKAARLKEEKEEKYVYKNRRAQMYGMIRLLLDPQPDDTGNPTVPGFGIPAKFHELRRQLAPIPLWYDEEGRIYLPPKNLKPGDDPERVTIKKLIGCSPDRADSLAIAVYGKFNRQIKKVLQVA